MRIGKVWLLSIVFILATAMTLQASDSSDFTYTTNSGEVTITSYVGAGGDVSIPDTIEGFPVTTIGNDAFYQCYSLTSVTIPDSVTTVGPAAF